MNDNESLVDELLTTVEAAAQLDVSESTLTRYRSHGTGPRYIRIGGKVRYRRSDLKAWITTIEPEDSQ